MVIKNMMLNGGKLRLDFYLQETEIVARNLIGKLFVKKYKNDFLIARITETEAYLDKDDLSCHANKGKTQRNKTMFEQGGRLYVYFIYGVHYCVNVVTKEEGAGAAVLIRAGKPLDGVNFMMKNRNNNDIKRLLAGPGNFAKAFDFTKKDDGISLLEDKVYIVDDGYRTDIATTERIGISQSKDLKLRFYDKNSTFISR